MKNNVIKYTAASAAVNAVDTLDRDDFYPFDGVMEDVEFSDALGDFAKKVGSGIKGKVEKFKDKRKERQSGQTSRLGNKEKKLRDRLSRKDERKTSRQTRKNLRQISRTKAIAENPPLNTALNELATKNPELKLPLDKNKEGQGSPKDEKTLDDAAQIAKDLAAKRAQEELEGKGKDELEPTPKVIIDETTGAVTKDGNSFSNLSTIAKVGIIGGGALTLGLIVFAIVKSTKK